MPRGGCSRCKGEERTFMLIQTLSYICHQSFEPTPWGGVVFHFGRSTYQWWKQVRIAPVTETNLVNGTQRSISIAQPVCSPAFTNGT